MNFSRLLNQILKGAYTYRNNGQTRSQTASKGGINDIVDALGGKTAAIGLLAMLFKRGKAGRLGKTGSLAALGAVAYYAYQKWQEKQGNEKGVLDVNAFTLNDMNEGNGSDVILQAMIAAAAADGEIDESERATILQEAGNDTEAAKWLSQQMAQPATPEHIAKMVNGHQALAAQVYLAARLISGEVNRQEMVFLAQLAQALALDPQLVEQLEQQVKHI